MVKRRDSGRLERIGDLIQVTLANILCREAEDPRFLEVTLTSVHVTRDMAHAKIYVSILHEENVKETIIALNKAAKYLRYQLAQQVELRIIPELHFAYDNSIACGSRIDLLLKDVPTSDSD